MQLFVTSLIHVPHWGGCVLDYHCLTQMMRTYTCVRAHTHGYTRLNASSVYVQHYEEIVTWNSAIELVQDLTAYVCGSGRNVTMDRFYTLVDLAHDLYQQHNLTVVGTIHQNCHHIPQELKETCDWEITTTLFAWDGPVMICSHIPKRNKNVLLLSSMHSQPTISQSKTRKLEVNLFYNCTKGVWM